MHLNHDNTEVYCHACLAWHNINTGTLWIPRDDGRIDIICMERYPAQCIHLGYDSDLD